ncbi:hypothetical protein Btru_073455 [Bulinus truncatus]|nr:hypothetical protein Btru_073455 [Bulinus truncatus]
MLSPEEGRDVKPRRRKGCKAPKKEGMLSPEEGRDVRAVAVRNVSCVPMTIMLGTDHPKMRFLYVAWAYLECFSFAGLTYGWASLVYVLKDEGIYRELCDRVGMSNYSNHLELDCHERCSQFDLVFTVLTSFIGVGYFVFGQITFKFGTRVTRVIAA